MSDDTEAESLIEPLLAEELVRIGLENFGLRFEFTGNSVEIDADFLFFEPSGSELRFDPSKRSGDVSALWRLIGLSVVEVDWGDLIVVTFADRSKITILPVTPETCIRGTLYGLFPKEGTLAIEDF